MDESRRMLEIADRLAEMEHGLAGLRARNDRSLRFARRELESLAEECQESRDSWDSIAARARGLLAELGVGSGDT